MTRTGPQRFPGASTAYWYQDTLGGSAMESNVIVWHSTEGTSLPSYNGGSEAPNFTAKPDFAKKRLTFYQHFDFDTSARALVNKAGGVETNTLNVCQVEIVGTCDPTTHKRWGSTQHLYTPELPDWAIRDLAAFAKWANVNHGVPLTSGVTFKAYPASYGSGAGVRMSAAKWTGFTGHCGHQHVPENDHGDPGSFPMAAILAAAKGAVPADPPPSNPPIKETPVAPTQITEGEAGGPELVADTWTLLRMAADSAIAQGPCSYNVAAYVSVKGVPGTRVDGRFHDLPLATGVLSADRPMHGGVIGPDGTLDVAFSRPGTLDTNEQLKLEIRANAAGAEVTYRFFRFLRAA
jgi:hypothetical protein